MADHRDQMMEWVLGRLRSGVDEGTEIAILLGELGRAFPTSDRDTANTIWKNLVARDDIFLNDGRSNVPLSVSFLGNLGLEEVWAAGLRGEKIRLYDPQTAAQNLAAGNSENLDGHDGTNAKRRASKEPLAEAPTKKRRGRPPKVKDAGIMQTIQAPQGHHSGPALPKRRGRPPKSKSSPSNSPASPNLIKSTKPRRIGGASRGIPNLSSTALQANLKLDSTLDPAVIVPSKFNGALQEIEALRSSLVQAAQAGTSPLEIQDPAITIAPTSQDIHQHETEPAHGVQDIEDTGGSSVPEGILIVGKRKIHNVQRDKSQLPKAVPSVEFDEFGNDVPQVQALVGVASTKSTQETQIHQSNPIEKNKEPFRNFATTTSGPDTGAIDAFPQEQIEENGALSTPIPQINIHLSEIKFISGNQQDQIPNSQAPTTTREPSHTYSSAIEPNGDTHQNQTYLPGDLPTVSTNAVAEIAKRIEDKQEIDGQIPPTPIKQVDTTIMVDVSEGIHQLQAQSADDIPFVTSDIRAQHDAVADCSPAPSDVRTPIKKRKYIRRGSQDTPKKPFEPRMKQSVYTSYEDLQYEAGADGVYIDPPGSEREDIGRRESSIIAIFKSAKLKDPVWLDGHKGSWVDFVAATIANKLLDVKDNTQSPKRKSQKADGSNTLPKKRGRPRKQVATPGDMTANHVASIPVAATQEEVQTAIRSLPPLGKPSQSPGDPVLSHPEPLLIQVRDGPKAVSASVQLPSTHSRSPSAPSLDPAFPASSCRSRTASVEPIRIPSGRSDAPSTVNSVQANSPLAQKPISPYVTLNRPQAAHNQPNTAQARMYQSPYGPPAVGVVTGLDIQTPGSTGPSNHQQALFRRDLNDSRTAVESSSAHRQPRAGTFQSSRRPSISINQRYQSSAPPTSTAPNTLGSFGPIFNSQAFNSALSGLEHASQASPSHASEYPHGSSSRPYTPGHTDIDSYAHPPPPGHHYGQFPRPPYLPDRALLQPLPTPSNNQPMHAASRDIYSQPQQNTYSHTPYSSLEAQQQQAKYGNQFSARNEVDQDRLRGANFPVLPSRESSPRNLPSIQPRDVIMVPHMEQIAVNPALQIATTPDVSVRPSQSEKPSQTFPSRKRGMPDRHYSVSEQAIAGSQSPPIKKPRISKHLSPESGQIDVFTGAEAVEFPGDVVRLACIHEGSAGNLVLSKDKTLLEFYLVTQRPPEVPKLVLKISAVTQNPITSVAGSKPMELRIKTKEVDGEEEIFKFSFSSTKSGCEKANEMRAKIVTAIMASRFRAGGSYERPDEVQWAILKPFHCEKCDARFKNKEGLAYHVTKSYTTCNPNLENMPRSKKPRKAVKPNHIAPPKKKLSQTPKHSHVPTDILATSTKRRLSIVENRPVVANSKPSPEVLGEDKEDDGMRSDCSNSSENSILEWCKENATTGIPVPTYFTHGTKKGNVSGNTLGYSHPKQRDYKIETFKPTKRRYKSLAGEAIVLQNVLDTIRTTHFQDATLIPIQTNISTQITAISIANNNFPPDLFSKDGCADLIMALIESHNGMFISGKSLFIAAIAVCIAKKPALTRFPPSRLFNRTLDELVAEEKLLEEEFEYIDNKARGSIIRSIVRLPGIPPKSELFQSLRKLALACHPDAYVPVQLCPPQPILEKLQALGANITKRSAIDGEPIENSQDEVQILPRTRTRGKTGGRERIRSVPRINHEDDLEIVVDEESESEKFFNDQALSSNRHGTHKGRRSRSLIRSSAREDFESLVDQEFEPEENLDESDPDLDGGPDLDNEFNSDHRADSTDGDEFTPNKRRQSGGWTVGRRKSEAHRAAITQGLEKYWNEKRRGQPYTGSYRRNRNHAIINTNSYQRKGPLTPEEREKRNRTRLLNLLEAERRQQMWGQAPAYMPNSYTGAWNTKPVEVKMPKVPRTYHTRRPGLVEPVTFMQAPNGAWSERPFGHGVKPVFCRPAKRVEGNPSHQIYLQGLLNGHRPIMYPPEKNRMYGPAAPSKAFLKKMTEQSTDESLKPETARKRRGGRRKMFMVETSPPAVGGPEDALIEPLAHESTIFRYPKRSTRPKASVVDFTNLAEVDALSFQQPIDSTAANQLNQWLQSPSVALDTLDSDANGDGPASKRQKGLDNSFIPRPRSSGRIMTQQATRAVVHLTTDFEGLGEDIKAVAKEMGVEIIEPGPVKKRMTKQKDVMSPAVEIRFMVAVVVIRILTGGVELQIDWMLVSTMFQDLSPNFLIKFWRRIVVDRKHIIDRLATEFQDKFPVAYENGDFPPLNYDNLVSYNWNVIIDWAIQKLDTCLNKNLIDLPESKDAIEAQFDQNEIDRDEENWRETFMQPLIPIYKRFEMAGGETLSIPVGPKRLAMEDEYELAVAKTFCRAIALTPEADYDHAGAIGKLTQLNLDFVNLAIKNLTDTKVIMHRKSDRNVLGKRMYEATDVFANPLRQHVKETQMIEAVEYKRYLDTFFRKEGGRVRIDYAANEGAVMCITSLAAAGRITLVPVNAPANKWGLTGGGYETKSIPRERLRFEIDVLPTNSYIFDSENEALAMYPQKQPPTGEDERIPVWYGISERVIPNLWKKVLLSVGQVLAFRAGISIDALLRTFKPTIDEWEMMVLLRWGLEVGIFKKLGENAEGWMVTEWWWLMVGRNCMEWKEE